MEFAPLTWRLPAWRCGARNERRPKGYSGKWGERRGSNPRPPEPQSGALPTELRSPQEKLLADPLIIEPPQTGGQFTARSARRSGPGGSAILSVFAVPAVFLFPSVLRFLRFLRSFVLAFLRSFRSTRFCPFLPWPVSDGKPRSGTTASPSDRSPVLQCRSTSARWFLDVRRRNEGRCQHLG